MDKLKDALDSYLALRAKLAEVEQERDEARAGWEAADTQISIEAGDVMRLTKERDELRAQLREKDDQDTHLRQLLMEEDDELRGALKAAQQSAQEQLERAIEAGNEWAMQYVEIDNAPMRVGDFIRAELSKGEKGMSKDIVEELKELSPHYPPRHILNRVLAEITRLHKLATPSPRTYEQGAEEARYAAIDAIERLREQIEDGSLASNSSDIALYEAQERIKYMALPTQPEGDSK